MNRNLKKITYVFLTLFLGLAPISGWTKSNEDRGLEIGKRIDEAEKDMKEKTKAEKKKAKKEKEKAKELAREEKEQIRKKYLEDKQRAKDKAHDVIEKF